MNLSKANNHLATNLYRLLAEEKKNVFFSPFTISTALITLFRFAEGKTEAELRTALAHYSFDVIVRESLAPLVKCYMEDLVKSESSYIFSSANCMLTHKDLEVEDDFKKILNESFKALLIETDFQSDSEKVIAQINDWVNERTNNMIPKMVESLDPAAYAVLLNAVYFADAWHYRFDKNLTTPLDFYNNGNEDEAKTVDMMYINGYFRYADYELFQVLQLPYIGEETKMVIILPQVLDGLENIERGLSVYLILNFCENHNVYKALVTLPRFRLEYSKSLIPALKRIGVTTGFSSDAELPGAFNFSDNFALDIFHKAVFEMNEDGAELATEPRNHPIEHGKCPQTIFHVDRPFFFVIYHKKSNLILFMGRVTEL